MSVGDPNRGPFASMGRGAQGAADKLHIKTIAATLGLSNPYGWIAGGLAITAVAVGGYKVVEAGIEGVNYFRDNGPSVDANVNADGGQASLSLGAAEEQIDIAAALEGASTQTEVESAVSTPQVPAAAGATATYSAVETTGIWPAVRETCEVDTDSQVIAIIEASGFGTNHMVPAGAVIELACGAGN